jgi:16S rRNA (uracil1498-N3)-methyltransferase
VSAEGLDPRPATLLRVPLALGESGLRELPAEAATYMTRVHRLGPGDRFLAFDPERAIEAEAEIVEVSRKGATARIEQSRPASRRPERRVTLLQGTCKGDKMDAIVRDATELGATKIVPVIGERSIARPDAARAERWRRIAVEAARQCGRGDVPRIEEPVALGALLARERDPEVSAFCLDPRAEAPLGAALAGLGTDREVAFLVGPEGGWSDAEIAEAARAGYAPARLGTLVLRTETVCAAVLGGLLLTSASPPLAP